MKVEVYPSKVSGEIIPPSSKSFLHRSIICAALSNGVTKINNVIYSEDVVATIEVFESIGVAIERSANNLVISSGGRSSFNINNPINCNESGSTIRFLIPILSNNKKVSFTGKTSLLSRPMSIYEDIFLNQGLLFKNDNTSIVTEGEIKPGNFSVQGDISSQFISGLLFILPLLNGDSSIEIIGTFESSNYVDMTISILRNFSIIVEQNENTFFVKGNQTFVPTEIISENDFSQLAFYAVLGTINNDIRINNINFDSFQPDRRIIDVVQSARGIVEKGSNYAIFKHSETQGFTFDVGQSPDIAPILAVLAVFSVGKTRLINAKRLVMKESNRLLTTYKSLKKLGANIIMGDDYLEIVGTQKLQGNLCDSFNDHRIAMTLAIAATVSESKITIDNAEAINKSYPNFYEDLKSLGVKINII
ncbi:MAG: 3-phosphoshikimate 1-carboxyvinyltransferase [Tenericutes bacterium]|nr:3-phosphoshikimate 1-carboxyvinyltransferase [Mycoplasmatota bacterium]